MLLLQHKYVIIFVEKKQVVGAKMRKNLLTTAILVGFISLNILPTYAGILSVNVIKSTITKSKTDYIHTDTDKEIINKTCAKSKADKKNLKDYKVKNKYDFINNAWWESFGDDYLNDYIQKAIEHNYDAKIATLNVDEYYHNVKVQFASELPTVGGGILPGLGGGGSGSSSGFFAVPVCVNYELDLFQKNHDKTKSVRKSYEASIQDERAAYISIVSAVGTTYLNIVKLDKLISTQENIVNLRKNIYQMMLLSNQKGTTSTSDVVKANKTLVAGQSDLIDLQRDRIQLLNQLAVLIGDSPANVDSLKRNSYENIKYGYNMPETLSSDIITQRPDFMKAELMLEKSGIDVRVAKKEFLPSLSIGGLALFNAPNIVSTSNTLWGLGGYAFESLYTGGKKTANLKINKVKYEKALDNYKKTNLVSIQEVNDAMYRYKYSNDKYKQNLIHQHLESQDYALSQKKFEQGVISKLDLDQMQENLLDINKLVVSNKLDCMIDSIGLYKATGSKY